MNQPLPIPTISLKQWWIDPKGNYRGLIYNDDTEYHADGTPYIILKDAIIALHRPSRKHLLIECGLHVYSLKVKDMKTSLD